MTLLKSLHKIKIIISILDWQKGYTNISRYCPFEDAIYEYMGRTFDTGHSGQPFDSVFGWNME
jgi:hypothetical protein